LKQLQLVVVDEQGYRYDETISASFVESTVNQVVRKRLVGKQQMLGAPRGAHLLLKTRTKVLNGDLGEDLPWLVFGLQSQW
jgi:hypothetical protein